MWLLMCCLSLPSADGEGYRLPTSSDPAFVPGMLVRGKAIKVETGDNSQQSTMVIEHVFAGDPALKGKTFTVLGLMNLGAAQDRTQGLNPTIKQGEAGIWRLRKDEDHGLIGCLDHNAADLSDAFLADIGWLGAFPTPWRRAVLYQVPYRAVLQWAETVETLYHKTDAERIPLLKAATLHDNPYVSAWSIGVLGRYKPPGLAKFLQEIAANSKLPVAGQVAVDEVLCQVSRKHWQNSKERQRLLARWIGGDVADYWDANRVIHRLVWAVKHGEMDWRTYLSVTTKWLTEQNVDNWHSRALTSFEPEDLSRETRSLVYEHSIRLVKEGNVDAARYGAHWLYRIRPFTKEERRTITQQLDDSKDTQVIITLKRALRSETP